MSTVSLAVSYVVMLTPCETFDIFQRKATKEAETMKLEQIPRSVISRNYVLHSIRNQTYE